MPRIAKVPRGPRGPVPKPASTRMGHRSKAERAAEVITLPGVLAPVEIPEPDPAWHPAILQHWKGIVASPQSDRYYQPSDWSFAWYACARESSNLSSARPSAQASQVFVSIMSDLLVAEGARRRLRIEVERTITPRMDDVARRWSVPNA